jgi:hypothetical protein
MRIKHPIRIVFDQLQDALQGLSDAEYAAPVPALSHNSIGSHVRHIIEMFQCLMEGYPTGLVDYARRKRNRTIEENKKVAIELLGSLLENFDRPNKVLSVSAEYADEQDEPIRVDSNYERELVFNLEHTIHHMALIRIGIAGASGIRLPESFGVAFATVNYRNQCAP